MIHFLFSCNLSEILTIFVAILLASALEPYVGWIRGHVGLGRGLTILLVYAVFFITVIGLALVVVPAAIAQFQDIVAGLPPLMERARSWAAGLRPAALSASVTALMNAGNDILSAQPPDPNAVVHLGLTVVEVAKRGAAGAHDELLNTEHVAAASAVLRRIALVLMVVADEQELDEFFRNLLKRAKNAVVFRLFDLACRV